MPVTAAQVQAAILGRTGDIDPTTGDPVVGGGGYLSTIIASLWTEYADKAYIAPRLQELYVERDLFDRMLALIQQNVDFNTPGSEISIRLSQRIATLSGRRDKVIEKLNGLVAMVKANRAPAVGQITATAPVGSPFPIGVDANSRRYGGDPYFRRPWNYP